MKPQIITVQEVRSYFNDLIPTLHKNDYFGFEDGARKYVKDLFNDIKQNLPNKLRKPAPKHFEKYGKNIYYASFKKASIQLGTCFSHYIMIKLMTFKYF